MTKAIALYLRLSQEDVNIRRDAAKDESNSVSAQRSLITRHIDESPDLCNLPRLEFCDDGFSVTNFSRPDFQRMIELTKQGEIGCIIVKDLSRFGRDYLEVGDYLEHIFPFLGIRRHLHSEGRNLLILNKKRFLPLLLHEHPAHDNLCRELSKTVKSLGKSRVLTKVLIFLLLS